MTTTGNTALPAHVVDELVSICGERHVLTETDTTAGYATDWTGRFVGHTPAVVRPGSTEEVAAVLRCCSDHGIHVVPQGGNTGLVGGSVPLAGEVVLSLRRLDQIEPIDELAHQVTVGAGATLSALHAHAASAGLAFGVDLAARDSCTLGGMVATNAGGIHVLRHGPTRSQIVGLEAVLSDGTVLSHMSGLHKDNTGYDLDRLMCGSEGTLAVITRVRLQLTPALPHRSTAMVGLDSVDTAVELVAHLRSTVPDLLAVEAIMTSAMEVVEECQGLTRPVQAEAVWLVIDAASATEDPTDQLAEGIAGFPEAENADIAVATDSGTSERLWAFRETITESINQLGVPHKLDVTLPASTLARFHDEVGNAVAAVDRDARVVVFGHMGDGNLHVNVLTDVPGDAVDGVVLELVAAHHGSISAEHGIGTAKTPWLHLSRSEAERSAFGAIRRALDPTGTLNPNVLVS